MTQNFGILGGGKNGMVSLANDFKFWYGQFLYFYYSSTMLTYFHSDANDTGCFKGFWVEQDKGFGFAQLVDNNWNGNINNCMSICLVNCNMLIKYNKKKGNFDFFFF